MSKNNRLVQKVNLAEMYPELGNTELREFYVTNIDDASLENLITVQDALKKLYEYEELEEKGLLERKKPEFTTDFKTRYNQTPIMSKDDTISVNFKGRHIRKI